MALKTEKCRITAEGGLAVLLTNKTGGNSVKGQIVAASDTVENAFMTVVADDYDPIGAVYESGIADGSECWVVVYGIAEVLLKDATTSTRGYWVRISSDTAGRADATAAAPSGGTIGEIDAHFREIGHCFESKEAGTDVLCKIIMHMN